jgi:hypothetical protein
MLTEWQEDKYKIFSEVIEQRGNFFFSSEDRNVGKTYLLNELGLELQALGYTVYILTPYPEHEYFAHGFIYINGDGYRGRLKENTVVLVDEARLYMMDEFLDYCKWRQIPVIGFVNYRRPYKPEIDKDLFIREYECNWIDCKN